MSEPFSTMGISAGLKAYGAGLIIGLCIVLVYLVVIMTRMPRTRQEWAVGLITTVVSSLAGGSFLVIKYQLHSWGADYFGMMALGGFYFVCGLPGWAIVRWIFNFINKREGADIFEVINEVRDEIKK
ncbi:MAG: hypothetical protein EOO69_04425 [Moraxellaceae bacterium]|nr:MAG: hypothetical protein EOO69_04425 [Moraxellaceae bacterium]